MRDSSLARIAAVMVKEFTQLRRDRITYAMILVMPLVQLLLFGYAINTDPRHLPAAVVSYDHSRIADDVVATLQNTTYVDVTHQPSSEAEMDRLMRRGSISLAVTIPPDFTHHVLKGERAQILAEVDASDPVAAGGVSAAVAALPAQALKHDLIGAAAHQSGKPPFEVVVHRLYNPEAINAYNVVPGLLAIILSMTLVMMTAMAVTREVERGTMESLLSTPATPFELMIGKLLPYIGVGLVQTVVVLTLGRLLFPHSARAGPCAGWFALSVGIVLFITGNLALGYLISTAGAQPAPGDAGVDVLHDAVDLPFGLRVPLPWPAALGAGDRRGDPGDPFPAHRARLAAQGAGPWRHGAGADRARRLPGGRRHADRGEVAHHARLTLQVAHRSVIPLVS